MGVASRFADPERPKRGIEFDGRLAEDFKLMSGTWVHVDALRTRGILALAPVTQDIVVTGHGEESVGFLIFASPDGVRSLCPDVSNDVAFPRLLDDHRVRDYVAQGLKRLAQESGGGSMFASAALLMPEPPLIDANEITDKGYFKKALFKPGRTNIPSTYLAGRSRRQHQASRDFLPFQARTSGSHLHPLR